MVFKLILINTITFIRIIGTIILVPIYKTYGGIYAGLVSLICYLTDSIDGILARTLKASTFFGALFDGFADKLLTVINFIILYLITPYAIIPIFFEILIVFVQIAKYRHKLNVQSNKVGKLKVWFLALSVVLAFIVSDINNFTILPINIINYLNSLNKNSLYFSLLLPTIIMEILTLISYILEIFKPINKDAFNEKEIKVKKDTINYENNWQNFKNIWLNPEYYKEHKNDINLKSVTKIKNDN